MFEYLNSLFAKEFHFYASSKIGYLQDRKFLGKLGGKTVGSSITMPQSVSVINIPNPFVLPGTTSITPIYFGNKRYELTDWLGNVRVVINDKKTPVNTGSVTVSYMPQPVNVSE